MAETVTAATRRFLLELWLEPREIPVRARALRGRITDLSSGRHRGVSAPHDVIGFVDEIFDAAKETPHIWGNDR